LVLAERLRGLELRVIVTSCEPKAVETGEIVAEVLGVPCEVGEGLHEHERPEAGLASAEAFRARMRRLFREPGVLVFGSETADEAHERFAGAVKAVLARHPVGNVGIVSHGTVITLLAARANGLDAVGFWKGLGLPACLVLSAADYRSIEVQNG
jgi:broad specificity phosphatase PhoE